jgi:Tfp pilus assembly protein PilO
MTNPEIIIIVLIIALGFLIMGFIVMLKRYNDLKNENNQLKYIALKSGTKTKNKEQNLYEYQSIIDKMKSRLKDKN